MADNEIMFELQPEAIPRAIEAAAAAVRELRILFSLVDNRISALEALLSALEAVPVPQVPAEPESPPEAQPEADLPYLGWQPGDEVVIQTMGSGQ